jgi:transmembrane sensor
MSAPGPDIELERAEQAATWAARLADGALPLAQQDEFQAWLDADPLNGDALEEVVGAWRSVEHYAASPQMMALREAALASARRTSRNHLRPASRRMIWGLLAATLLIVIGGAGLWAWTSPHVYRTEVGERRIVVLNDGSKISLDGATEVRVSYVGDRRRLWLDHGRAKFDVAKDSLRPFSVAAADKVVVATGTAFSVERVQGQVRVVLYEGHVALLQRDGGKPPQTLTLGAEAADKSLKPGREMILAVAPQAASAMSPQVARDATVTAADPVRSLAWEGGQLVFEDEPLSVAVERMNRYADKPLRIADPHTAQLRISGVFRAGDTEAMVQGLEAAFQVHVRRGADSLVLFSKSASAPAD